MFHTPCKYYCALASVSLMYRAIVTKTMQPARHGRNACCLLGIEKQGIQLARYVQKYSTHGRHTADCCTRDSLLYLHDGVQKRFYFYERISVSAA